MKTQTEQFILDKRSELMWALSDQGYNLRQLSTIFGVSKSQAHVIVNNKPKGWTTPWVKK